MSHFLGLSWNPDSDRTAFRHLQGMLSENTQQVFHQRENSFGDAILASVHEGDQKRCFSDNTCLLVKHPLTISGLRIESAEHFQHSFIEEGFGYISQIVPPFAAVWFDPKSHRVQAATDTCGLQHIYYTSNSKLSAVSSSAAILAALTGADLDVDSIAMYSQVGSLLGNRTFYQGIHKVPAGHFVTLESGHVRLEQYDVPQLPAPADRFKSLQDAIDAGCEVVRNCVQSALNAHPSMSFELSGGLDSRLLFASIPAADKRNLNYKTIGDATSPDLKIARRLASLYDLNQQAIDISELGRRDPEELLELGLTAARRCEFQCSPLSRIVIESASAQMGPDPRMGGPNGEFARGFFYPGQPDAPQVTPTLIDNLIRWRICVNQVVSPELFVPEIRDTVASTTRKAVHAAFTNQPGDWLTATDEFYLKHRMQRWAGAAISTASPHRPVVLPLFSPQFIHWARRVPPHWKRDSFVLAHLVRTLDPQAAAIPLDSGDTLPKLVSTGLVGKMHQLLSFSKKATSKLTQKLFGQHRSGIGESAIAQRIFNDRPFKDLFPNVLELDLIDEQAFFSVDRERHKFNTPTMSLLILLESIAIARKSRGLQF